MRRTVYRLFTYIQHLKLKAKGYRMGNNVIVSNRGVRKIGGGKIICADNVSINAEVMFVAFKDITIGRNSTLAYRVMISTSAIRIPHITVWQQFILPYIRKFISVITVGLVQGQ